MRATQRKQFMPEHDDQSRHMRLRRLVQDFTRYGNDNLRTGSVEALVQSKRRTWEMFARWLMLCGLLFGIILIAVLAFVYSGYP
jgi:hypothetical protein